MHEQLSNSHHIKAFQYMLFQITQIRTIQGLGDHNTIWKSIKEIKTKWNKEREPFHSIRKCFPKKADKN